MLEEFFKRGWILDAADLAIDTGPRESLPHEIGKQIAMLTLRLADQRREDHHALVLAGRDDPLHDLVAGLGLEHTVALRTVGRADPRIEYAEKVVDLRHRGDGRPGIVAGRFLCDRDRRREAGDAVDIRPRQLAEKLPGEGGETLDVAPLPLGVECVEGEARLARPAHAGQADEPATGQADRHIAEVVLAGTADDDRGNVHGQTHSARTGRGHARL